MAKALITTPKGTAVYPWLNTADTKFGDPVYKTGLRIPAEHAEAFIAKLEDVFNEFYEKKLEEHGKKKMRTEDFPWEENDDGSYTIKLKLNKIGKNSKTQETWENSITFFDAKAKPIPAAAVPKIGGGSTLRVSFEPVLYEVSGKLGISTRIKKVQVIEAVQGGGADTDAGDFGEEEGYSYDPESFDADADADNGDEDF